VLPVRPDPLRILERIEQWWQSESGERLRQYDRRVYSNGHVPRLVAPWDDGFDRREWLILFQRAAFHRMGRVTDQQHRAFVEMSERNGFMRVYSAENPRERADDWMDVLERFCDQQVESLVWDHWMRFFPQFYKLSRWLDEYAELFLNLGLADGPYDLETVLTTRTDSRQQGGGISAPPPGLGIGACFVVRELLRHNHITNEHAHDHAFVPSGAVRDLMIRIGLEIEDEPDVRVSAQILEEIASHIGPVRARFGQSYDIPFRIIAEDVGLQDELIAGERIAGAGH